MRPDYVLRLMPKEGSYVEGYVHPAIITPYPTEKLQHPMYLIKVYLLQGGILDGKMGFILSVNHYFYTMTKYVKFYYLLKSKGKL